MKNLSKWARGVAFVAVLSVLITPSIVSSQVLADTLHLNDVVVYGERFRLDPSLKTSLGLRLERQDIQTSGALRISDALDIFTPVTVRNYGLGGFSNVAMRGYAARQTRIYWNGFELNNPMLGEMDMSLIPAGFVDFADVTGDGAQVLGSGGLGGQVHLRSDQKNTIAIGRSVGSFGQNWLYLGGGITKGSFNTTVKVAREESDNDFPFTMKVPDAIEPGGLRDSAARREFNRTEAWHILSTVSYTKDNMAFETTYWHTDVTNGAPGSLQFLSPSTQYDRSHRLMSSMNFRSEHGGRLGLKYYYNNQDLDFRSSFGFDQSNFVTHLGELNHEMMLTDRIEVLSSAALGRTEVTSTIYNDAINRISARAAWKFIFTPLEPIRLFATSRFENFSDVGTNWAASLGTNYTALKDLLYVRAELSRDYVMPTMNDLYWPLYGNPNLNTETQQKAELGFTIIEKSWLPQVDVSLYLSEMNNAIRWIFTPDFSSGQATNIDQLRSYGFDIFTEKRFSFDSIQTRVFVLYSFNDTRLTKPREGVMGDLGHTHQFIYVPQHTLKWGIQYGYKNMYSRVDQQFTGQRTTSFAGPFGEASLLEEFWQTNFTIGIKSDMLKKVNNSISLLYPELMVQVRNIFDQRYEFIEGYPMPGRNVLATIRLSL